LHSEAGRLDTMNCNAKYCCTAHSTTPPLMIKLCLCALKSIYIYTTLLIISYIAEHILRLPCHYLSFSLSCHQPSYTTVMAGHRRHIILLYFWFQLTITHQYHYWSPNTLSPHISPTSFCYLHTNFRLAWPKQFSPIALLQHGCTAIIHCHALIEFQWISFVSFCKAI
jgi:hypothetical protein